MWPPATVADPWERGSVPTMAAQDGKSYQDGNTDELGQSTKALTTTQRVP